MRTGKLRETAQIGLFYVPSPKAVDEETVSDSAQQGFRLPRPFSSEPRYQAYEGVLGYVGGRLGTADTPDHPVDEPAMMIPEEIFDIDRIGTDRVAGWIGSVSHRGIARQFLRARAHAWRRLGCADLATASHRRDGIAQTLG